MLMSHCWQPVTCKVKNQFSINSKNNAVHGVKNIADLPSGAQQPCKLTAKKVQSINLSVEFCRFPQLLATERFQCLCNL